MQLQTISKALLATAAGSLFALGAAPAFAQDTATLAVKGSIVPAACSANFTGGDTVDFGTIKVVDLLSNSYNLLGSKNTELHVNCSVDKTVDFSLHDTQASSRVMDGSMASLVGVGGDTAFLFGLGTATASGNPNVNLGAYSIEFSHAPTTVDGADRTVYYYDGGKWGAPSQKHYWSNNGRWISKFTAGLGGRPSAGQTFVFPMRITAGLNKGSALQVAADTPLNGQAVFTINYQ